MRSNRWPIRILLDDPTGKLFFVDSTFGGDPAIYQILDEMNFAHYRSVPSDRNLSLDAIKATVDDDDTVVHIFAERTSENPDFMIAENGFTILQMQLHGHTPARKRQVKMVFDLHRDHGNGDNLFIIDALPFVEWCRLETIVRQFSRRRDVHLIIARHEFPSSDLPD
jgi:hypothetical protein